MFMSVRVFRSVVFKLANVPLNMPVSSSRLADVCVSIERGHASDSYSRKQPKNEEDFGADDVDAQIEAVIREEKKKMKNVKFQKIHRQLRPKGAPARKLTWEAIEQIRFLKRESPEEWTIQRLATGFSVTPDEICRILRSKFNPNPERKLRQDTVVLAKQQQQTLADGTKVPPSLLPRSSTPATLPPGTTGALVVAQKSQEMAKVDSRKVSLGPSKLSSALSTAHAITTIPTHQKDDIVASEMSEKFEEDGVKEDDYSEDEGENEEVWDGVTFSDAELQDFAQTMTEKHIPVEKRGKEYFDSKGNFLYRI